MSNLRLFDPTFTDPFENTFRRFLAPALHEAELQPMRMRVDVSENDQGYTVKADIPGVRKEDISVRVDGNIVQIDAETRREHDEKGNGDKLVRSERYYGTISRAFSLAQDVDDAKVDAKYADGVLTLQLPKKAATPGKKITVQ